LQGAFAPGGDPLASANRSAGVRQAARIPCSTRDSLHVLSPIAGKARSYKFTVSFA